MIGARLVEFLVCLVLALIVHLAILFVLARPDTRSPDATVALTPATPALTDLVAAWDRPPETASPTPGKPPATQGAPRPPAQVAAAPERMTMPLAPQRPLEPTKQPTADNTPLPRPTPPGVAPAPLVVPAPFAATELQTSRAALHAAPRAPRAPLAVIPLPQTGTLPTVDLRPAAPPPPAPVAPTPQPTPEPEPASAPPTDPSIPDAERGPPTAQAPASTQRPTSRPPGFRPGPFVVRPTARPANLSPPG